MDNVIRFQWVLIIHELFHEFAKQRARGGYET